MVSEPVLKASRYTQLLLECGALAPRTLSCTVWAVFASPEIDHMVWRHCVVRL